MLSLHIISKKLFFLIIATLSCTAFGAPRLTVIFVIDQFAHHYIERIKPYLKGGIAFLLDNGIVYQNAYFPHAMPSTATGHAALNTGCFAKDHGLIGNKWFGPQGEKIYCDDDSVKNAAVFGSNGKTLNYGKSAKNLAVGGVSDQIMLQHNIGGTNKVFSLSFKSRSAIATAGKLGKAVWFLNGNFTSSKAYFDTLPEWITNFNKNSTMPKQINWSLLYPEKTGAYAFKEAKDYTFTTYKTGFMNKPIPVPDTQNKKNPYALMMMTPYANDLLLDLAFDCINTHLSKNKKDKLVVWVCLSSLDKLGHRLGPNSIEIIDMLYHLDKQIKNFMNKIEKKVAKKEILFALTADHGIAPIPEKIQQSGIKSARRINVPNLVKKANELIKKKHGIEKLIFKFKTPQFFFNETLFQSLEKKQQNDIIDDLKVFLLADPSIKNVWTRDELLAGCYASTDIALLYKNQIYPGRSGYLSIQVSPYAQTTKYTSGTAHRTPYEHNTHVPLVLYQKGTFGKKVVTQRVSMLQFANTIAHIVAVPKPPASLFTLLPGIFAL